jgi:hypothetical protein
MEFTINSVDYRATKLSVFDQLKVCRKLLPVLSSIVPDLSALHKPPQLLVKVKKRDRTLVPFCRKLLMWWQGCPKRTLTRFCSRVCRS